MANTPFWIGRYLTDKSQKNWTDWAVEYKLTIVPPAKMHFTQFYDATNDKPWPEPFDSYFSGIAVGVGNLGNASVLFFNAPDLVDSRFKQLSADYTHSFPSLMPHVTLLYEKSSQEDLVRLHSMLPSMPVLEFGSEIISSTKSPEELERVKVPHDFSADISVINSGITADIAKSPDSLRSEFLTAFGKALADNPEVISSWRGKNPTAYKNAWRKILEVMAK